MEKLILKILLSFFAAFSIMQLHAQSVQIKCGEQNFSIPDFKEDSVQSFNNNEVQNQIIYPIQQSIACIEIRLYGNEYTNSDGKILVLKFVNDTVAAKIYQYKYYNSVHGDPYEYIGKNIFNQNIGRRIIMKNPTYSAKKIFDSLKKYKVFEIADYTKFLKNAQQNNLIMSKNDDDCLHCVPVLLEIKLAGKFRNFFLPITSDLFRDQNNIDYFKNSNAIISFIISFFTSNY